MYNLDTHRFQPELTPLIHTMNHFCQPKNHMKPKFLPQCCRDFLSHRDDNKQDFENESFDKRESLVSFSHRDLRKTGSVNSIRDSLDYKDSNAMQTGRDITTNKSTRKRFKSFLRGRIAPVRIRQFIIENEDKNAIATQNLYAKSMMRYD